jgi:hypothetical protein
VTELIRGSDIRNYINGNEICKNYFGPSSKFATVNDGHYMTSMNSRPIKVWSFWKWEETLNGSENMWGYFNHHYRGRAWVWNSNEPDANCS